MTNKRQLETDQAMDRLRRIALNTVSHHAMIQGLLREEPLFYALDGAIRYAKAYKKRHEQMLSEDYVLGPSFLKWITGLRELLNGDGAVAMEMGWATDSKDNGTLENMFWSAMELSGFKEEDI